MVFGLVVFLSLVSASPLKKADVPPLRPSSSLRLTSQTPSETTDDLWSEYVRVKKTKKSQFRSARLEQIESMLIKRLYPLAKGLSHYAASRYVLTLRDDLEQEGLMMLLPAIQEFDPSRKVKFEAYLSLKMRRRMLDVLREQDWVPRLVRARQKQVTSFRTKYERLSDEDRDSMGDFEAYVTRQLGVDDAKKILRDGKTVRIQKSLSQLEDSNIRFGSNAPESGRKYEMGDPRNTQDRPDEGPDRQSTLIELSRGLRPDLKQVLILYYVEQATMKEIAMTLNLSESRVSQLHADLLKILRAKLNTCPELLKDLRPIKGE